MIRFRCLAVLLLAGAPFGWAQEVSLGREDLRSRILEANTDLKISEAAYRQAQGEYQQTNAIFLPNITASHTAMVTTNPLMAFGSKLNQGILTPADFDPALLNNPDRTENFATRLEVSQPLLNLDGFYQRRAARFKMQAADLQSERRRDYLNLESEQAFMQLQLAHKGVQVLEKALEAARANQKLAESNFRQGYLQKSDVLAVNVRVTEVENQLRTARSQVANTSNYLSFLMNETPGATYLPTDSLMPQPAPDTNPLRVSEERADIQAMADAALARKNVLSADKMSFLPRLNAFGSYELYDDQLFQFGASGYTVGAQLSWNILDGSKRFGKAQSSQAAYDQALLEQEQYLAQSRLELERAKRSFADARGKLEMTALAREQSREALRIRTNRFREGLEKTSDLLVAETSLAQKELEYYQTVFEHNYALAYLEFLSVQSENQTP